MLECPVCGCECVKIYTNLNGEVIGCDNEINEWEAEEWEEWNEDI